MSEIAEMWREVAEHRKEMRAKYGIACPKCVELLPRACPSILLPNQACKIHRYRDPRPRLTVEQEWHIWPWPVGKSNQNTVIFFGP